MWLFTRNDLTESQYEIRKRLVFPPSCFVASGVSFKSSNYFRPFCSPCLISGALRDLDPGGRHESRRELSFPAFRLSCRFNSAHRQVQYWHDCKYTCIHVHVCGGTLANFAEDYNRPHRMSWLQRARSKGTSGLNHSNENLCFVYLNKCNFILVIIRCAILI